MDYDYTDPKTDRRKNEISALAQEVHKLGLLVNNPPKKSFFQRYASLMSFALTLIVLIGSGYGGYTVLESTVNQYGERLQVVERDKVDRSDLMYELRLRDADIENVKRSQRESSDRINEQLKSMNGKLDKLIERELNGK